MPDDDIEEVRANILQIDESLLELLHTIWNTRNLGRKLETFSKKYPCTYCLKKVRKFNIARLLHPWPEHRVGAKPATMDSVLTYIILGCSYCLEFFYTHLYIVIYHIYIYKQQIKKSCSRRIIRGRGPNKH